VLQALIANDDLFRTHPTAAYAEAWALSFLLIETQPAKYLEYLARTAAHEPFVDLTSAERTADFTAVFGDNWEMLAARLLRFIESLE
jgi:hypothetical protein